MIIENDRMSTMLCQEPKLKGVYIYIYIYPEKKSIRVVLKDFELSVVIKTYVYYFLRRISIKNLKAILT